MSIAVYKGVRVWPKKKINKSLKGKRRRAYGRSFLSPFKKDTPKNLIVMYDIPDNLKRERDWLRRQLVHFGYVMIQRSIWVGPSPLPSDFKKYLKEIKIKDKLKTFKLAKAYIK